MASKCSRQFLVNGKRGRPSYYSQDLQEFQFKKASFTDLEERKKFVKERRDLVCQMDNHGALLEAWATDQAKDRSEQLEDLRRERKEAIIEKLTELGWGPEIEQIQDRDDLSHHRLVKQPIRLTPRIWANIQDEMVAYMVQMKNKRLERERKALVISRKGIAVSILRAYKISRLPTDVVPEPMDFCAISQVSDILELPTETEVTEDTFGPIVEKMDELVGEWRTQILATLVQKVKDSLYSQKHRVNRLTDTADSTLVGSIAGSSSADPMGKGKAKAVERQPSVPDDSRIIQDLSLATTVFNCRCCNPRFGTFYGLYDSDFSSDTDSALSEDDLDPWDFGLARRRPRANPLFFPMVLGHRCLTKQHAFNWDNPDGDPTKQYDYPLGNRTRWACHLLQVDEKAGKMAANVITTCGLDPKGTTVAEMDQMDHLLVCLECLEWSDEEWDEADAPVFGWRAAVTHNCRSHPGKTNIGWMLIEDELLDDVVDVDEEDRANRAILSAFGLHALVPGDAYADPPEEVVWLCAECLDLPKEGEPLELSKMKDHLNSMHSISEPQENRHYYKDYEALQSRKARIPHLKITLTMDRPDNVPGPGESRSLDPWCFGFMDPDDFDDDYYSDDFF
jgi:hypothetical protein